VRRLCAAALAWTVYIVASQSEQEHLVRLVQQLTNHEFSRNLELRVVTFEQFENTQCFRRAIESDRVRKEYLGAKSGDIHGLYSLIHHEATEQAIIIPADETFDLPTVEHELGHVSAARTPRGKERRVAYESEREELDRIVGTQHSRSLAERSMGLPEDHEIERTIVSSLDNEQSRTYLGHAYNVYRESLEMLEGGDASPVQWKRRQTALHRLQYSLASRSFAEIAQECDSPDLSGKFMELSGKFADSQLLSDVSIDRLFTLMTQGSPGEWARECSNAIKNLVMLTRQSNR
jgi:hypothetical protein